MDVVSEKTALLNALKNANILNHDDLLLFENHSLDNKYSICGLRKCKRVTILMLLINLLDKYPLSSYIINGIIKKYIEKVPEEVHKISEYYGSAILLCVICSFTETIKILLNKGTNINHQYDDDDGYKWTAIHVITNYLRMNDDGLSAVKFLIEYDANTNIKDKDGEDALDLCDDDDRDKVNKILEDIASLNTKN